MNYYNLSDEELEAALIDAKDHETNGTTRVLHILREVERRRLYSKKYPSLFQYCVSVLKYDGSRAQRRIDTMRAMKIMPEIEAKIVSGELNMTVVGQAQKFFRQEAKIEKKYSVEEKRALFAKLENKSTKETIQTLIAISPQSVPQEKRRQLTVEKTELRVSLDKDVIEMFDQIKALLSHKNPQMTDAELLREMAKLSLKVLDPAERPTRSRKSPRMTDPKTPTVKPKQANSLPLGEVNSKTSSISVPKSGRYIPVALKKAVWVRDKGRCTYERCTSQYFIQWDHIVPVALGGKTELSNLRLLCHTHNQRAAIESFGLRHIGKFINSSELPDST